MTVSELDCQIFELISRQGGAVHSPGFQNYISLLLNISELAVGHNSIKSIFHARRSGLVVGEDDQRVGHLSGSNNGGK